MNHEQVFFNILRSSLCGSPIIVPQEFIAWRNVFSLAKSQSVLALVANAVMNDAALASKVPDDTKMRLKSFVMANMAAHSILNNTLIRVVSLLNEAGINSVLLKGQGLARNYPVPELRQCGDIDLYVQEEDYERVYNILSSVATEIDEISSLSDGKHFHVTIGKILVEVHRFAEMLSSSSFNNVYQEYASAGLRDNLIVMNVAGVDVNTPSDNFNAFYIFYHLWHHFMTEGVGLRQLCDWMMFLHSRRGCLNADYLKTLLERMDLLVPWKTFGCILVNQLGMSADEFPLYDSKFASKSRKVLERILAEGNFGKESAYYTGRQHKGYLYEKWYSFKCRASRSIRLFFMFPIHSMRYMTHLTVIGFKAVFNDMSKSK